MSLMTYVFPWLILVHEFVTIEVEVVYVCVICSVQVNRCNNVCVCLLLWKLI
jgi:hypothetical protein